MVERRMSLAVDGVSVDLLARIVLPTRRQPF